TRFALLRRLSRHRDTGENDGRDRDGHQCERLHDDPPDRLSRRCGSRISLRTLTCSIKIRCARIWGACAGAMRLCAGPMDRPSASRAELGSWFGANEHAVTIWLTAVPANQSRGNRKPTEDPAYPEPKMAVLSEVEHIAEARLLNQERYAEQGLASLEEVIFDDVLVSAKQGMAACESHCRIKQVAVRVALPAGRVSSPGERRLPVRAADRPVVDD